MKKKHQKTTEVFVTRSYEKPNEFNQQHHQYEIQEGKARRASSSVLEKYQKSGTITAEQARAGQRLYQSAVIGGVLSGIKGQDYTSFTQVRQTGPRGPENMSDYRVEKLEEFRNAMYSREIGRVGREILWHVCIEDGELSNFDRDQKSTLYARMLLKETLEDLITHYKGI